MRLAASVLLAMVSIGCAADADEHPLPAREPFLAFGSHFEGFRDWQAWQIPDVGTRTGHDGGEPRWVYANTEPPPWGEPFPVGSIVVKTLEIGEMPEWEVHAMVKRGGGYNDDGAVGWEWFDLLLTAEGRPAIIWRGEGSIFDPGGYGPVAGSAGTCNGCHGFVPGNDYVFMRAAMTP